MGTRNPSLALRRARLRRSSGGAALFVVAVTLGLLAAMGVYGLAATSYDVRAAGYGRQAAQGQHAAQLALTMTATMLTGGNARIVMNDMMAEATLRDTERKACVTSKPLTSGSTSARDRVAEACLTLTTQSMRSYSADPTNYPTATAPVTVPFTSESFGEVPTYPNIRVELTNPVDWDVPAGFSIGSTTGPTPVFTVIRATVFSEMRPAPVSGVLQPAQSIVMGRGRLVVGPYMQ